MAAVARSQPGWIACRFAALAVAMTAWKLVDDMSPIQRSSALLSPAFARRSHVPYLYAALSMAPDAPVGVGCRGASSVASATS
jgi:hypothetical protein